MADRPVHVSRRPLSTGQRVLAVPIVGACLVIAAAGRVLDQARSIGSTLAVGAWLARHARVRTVVPVRRVR